MSEASDLCDEEYDNALWVAWFNDAIDNLADVLFISDRVSINAVNGLFPVPENLKSIIRIDSVTKNIKPLQAEDDTSIGYRIIGNNFEIQGESPTTIDLTYYKNPDHISLLNSDADIDLSDRVIGAIKAFACAQGMLRDDEQERYEAFYSQFLQAKGTIERMYRTASPSRTGVIEVVR